MASAEKTVFEEKIIVEKHSVITLTLSQEEAQVLRDLLGGHVLGKLSTRRRITNDIFYALVPVTSSSSRLDITGYIRFEEVDNG